MYQGIFIDNQKADKHFASLMSTPGKNGLTVKFQQSAELIKLAKNILVNQPNLVVLDSHLNKDYKATPLAQQLRDYTFENVAQDFPIVLVSHEDKINEVYQVFSKNLKNVEYLIGYEGNAFAFTGDVESDILSITSVHPMRKEGVETLLAKASADWGIVNKLMDAGKLVELSYLDHKFYMRKISNPTWFK